MKARLKSAIFFCLYYSGLEWVAARLLRVNAVAMLMYHGVCDEAPIPPEINFHVGRAVFERQMRALKRRYRVIRLQDLVTALTRREPLEKAVILTFDDGYRNNATDAAPVLERLGLPYTVFVSTAYVGNGRWMPLNRVYWRWAQGKLTSDDMQALRRELRSRPAAEADAILERGANGDAPATPLAEKSFSMLDWDQVRSMARAGAEFGSHTHFHCNMAVENEARQHEELTLSKELLERNLGQPVRSFAYPYGHVEQISEVARASVIRSGYDCAISAEEGLVTADSDLFRLPRIGYDTRMWMFTCEILYHFVRQKFHDMRAASPARSAGTVSRQTKGHHG